MTSVQHSDTYDASVTPLYYLIVATKFTFPLTAAVTN